MMVYHDANGTSPQPSGFVAPSATVVRLAATVVRLAATVALAVRISPALAGPALTSTGQVHAELSLVAPEAGQWLQSSVSRQLQQGDALLYAYASDTTFELWFDSSATRSQWSADDRAVGFRANRSQGLVGLDVLEDQPLRLGVGFSYSLNDISRPGARGSLKDDIPFVYGEYGVGNARLDGVIAVSASSSDTSRTATLPPAPAPAPATTCSSRYDGASSLIGGVLRWLWLSDPVSLQPFGSATWQKTSRHSFDESGSSDTLYSPGNTASGVRLSTGISVISGASSLLGPLFTYRVDASVGRESNALVRTSMEAMLEHVPVTLNAPGPGRFFAQLSLAGTLRVHSRLFLSFGVSDEARRRITEQAAVLLGIHATL